MCDETGVLVAPGSFFGVPDAFRISAMREPALVEEGLRTLAARLL
jgi:aspartate/methionine/tyrosine aminotransferase